MSLPITPDAQQAAILASRDPLNLIYGNAGSSKTTTLALQGMAALGKRVPPAAVQVLTYSPPRSSLQGRLSSIAAPQKHQGGGGKPSRTLPGQWAGSRKKPYLGTPPAV